MARGGGDFKKDRDGDKGVTRGGGRGQREEVRLGWVEEGRKRRRLKGRHNECKQE